jgi:hypothetical protein
MAPVDCDSRKTVHAYGDAEICAQAMSPTRVIRSTLIRINCVRVTDIPTRGKVYLFGFKRVSTGWEPALRR